MMTVKWPDYFSKRSDNICGSQIRQYFALTEKPEVISFAGGFPGNDFFPNREIARALKALMHSKSKQALQYGPTEGSFELRTYLAQKMQRASVITNSENIIITDGSQQGLDLLSRLLVNPGDPVLVEEPSYLGGISAIKSYGGLPVGINLDEEGPNPAEMEKKIVTLNKSGKKVKVFYTVPSFQNPTGTTTSHRRRQEILKIAERNNLLIIEDDPYGELYYNHAAPISYKALDEDDRVIYLGSYSKVLIPGIRIGWMVGSTPLISKVSMAKQTNDLCSSSLGQELACHLSQNGFVDKHTGHLRHLYSKKKDLMVKTMRIHFPQDIIFNNPTGGFFIWVQFPEHYPPAKILLDKALKNNVAFVHGEGFFSNGGGAHCARFSFSQASDKNIIEGIKRISHILHGFTGLSSFKTGVR